MGSESDDWADRVLALKRKVLAKERSIRTLLGGIATIETQIEEIRDARGQGHTSYAADYTDRGVRLEWAGLHEARKVAEDAYERVCRDENRAYKKFMKQLKKGTAK